MSQQAGQWNPYVNAAYDTTEMMYRQTALQMAIGNDPGGKPDDIIKAAEKFASFVLGKKKAR